MSGTRDCVKGKVQKTTSTQNNDEIIFKQILDNNSNLKSNKQYMWIKSNCMIALGCHNSES